MHRNISFKIATHGSCWLHKRSIRSSMFCMHHPLLLTTEPFHKVMIGGRGAMIAPLITCSLLIASPLLQGILCSTHLSQLCKDHRPSLTWRNCCCSFELIFFWFTRITRRYNRFCLSGTQLCYVVTTVNVWSIAIQAFAKRRAANLN